jgi:hypothetical protein
VYRSLTSSHNSKNLQFDHDVPTLTAADTAIHPPTTPLTEEHSRPRPHQSSAPIASMVQMTPLATTASITQARKSPPPPSLHALLLLLQQLHPLLCYIIQTNKRVTLN